MASRRRVRAREAQLTFEALSIEGGLLSPEWLARIAQLGAGSQSEADYRIPKGLNLRDEIGRYWRIAQAHWADFARGRAAGAPARPAAEAFVTALLREAFGFGSLAQTAPVTVGERTFPVGHLALEGRVPVVVAAPRAAGPAGEAGEGSALDALDPALGDGGRRRSPFGLAQEYLNAEQDALWALVSDGLTLRLCRDNASLTRPAWIEADLARIFGEERYADFAALWLLAHETRFGAPGHPAAECPLEAWRNAGREEGTRAREHLRDGVEEALAALGRGFLSHPENQALREALHGGALGKQELFQELLRLVYRLLFLLTVEERDLLHPAGAPDAARALYAQGYGLRRLRERSVRRSAHDRFGDLWEGLRVVLRGVAAGEPRLGLPALGGLFAADQCPHLDAARLENRWLLTAVYRLSWLKEETGLSRVNWRDMGPEELGSVYESLLELVPVIPPDYRGFGFARGDESKGNARKTTGSYYTPDSLVQVLLDSALEPVVKDTIAAHPGDPAGALLALTVVDPACGSGHFLLAAARRLAVHLARLQAGGTPSAAEYRHALRQVVSRCVFGVDLNPMAVELCRVALWMEAVEPGLPLSFLDSHIQCGNALLGTTPELMARGVPDAAWEAIEGDDRKTASLLRKRNKAAAEGQRGLPLWDRPGEGEAAAVQEAVAALDAAPDADLAGVAGKEASWEELKRSPAYRHQKLVADAWCAAFVWPKPALDGKKAPPEVEGAPTNELWRQLRDGQAAPAVTVKTVEELAGQYHFFHWHLQFPQVFARGGFDVVLGNPPWEKINFREEEYFGTSHPEIANAPTKAARKRLIESLKHTDRASYHKYAEDRDRHLRTSGFFRFSGYFPLTGVSRINLYSIFCETGVRLLAPSGRLGMVLASGIVTDDNNKTLFTQLIERGKLVHAWDFENRERVFPDVHSSFKFCLFCAAGTGPRFIEADFAFFLTRVAHLSEAYRHFTLTTEDLRLLNPESGTCPTFRSERDAKLAKAIHRKVQAWVLHSPRPGWPGTPKTPFNMANDSGIFIDANGRGARDRRDALLGLYEAKYVHQFDHRYASCAGGDIDAMTESTDAQHHDPAFEVDARYLLPASFLAERFPGSWFMAWRDITCATNERTAIASILPARPCGHTLSIVESLGATGAVTLTACMNSFVFDFCARQKVPGTHLNHSIWRQLPLVAPDENAPPTATTVAEWLMPRVRELCYTSWDLKPFAKDTGYDGPPFHWDPARRFLLRAELDAAFFHLYGISHDDADYILETFPIVRKNDEKAHGEYRTKRVILEIYDEMAEAIRTGKPYQTRLDPPPADPRCAHAPNPRRSESHT